MTRIRQQQQQHHHHQQKMARPRMNVYYVEHSFARPDPSATTSGEIATQFSLSRFMAFCDLSLPRFRYPPSLPFNIFPSTSIPFKFSAHDTMAITFTLQIGSAYKNGVESRVAAQQRCKKQIMRDMIKFSLSNFTFEVEQILRMDCT